MALVLGGLSLRLPLGALTAPGPGFFPFCLSVALAVTAVTLVLTEAGHPHVEPAERPAVDAGPAARPAAVVFVTAVVAAYGLALEVGGLVIATAALLLILWLVVERLPVVRAVAATAFATAATWLLFDVVLRVRFPRGFF